MPVRARPGDVVVDPDTQAAYRVVKQHESGWLTVQDTLGRLLDIGPHRRVVRKRNSGTIPIQQATLRVTRARPPKAG